MRVNLWTIAEKQHVKLWLKWKKGYIDLINILLYLQVIYLDLGKIDLLAHFLNSIGPSMSFYQDFILILS